MLSRQEILKVPDDQLFLHSIFGVDNSLVVKFPDDTSERGNFIQRHRQATLQELS
jgi:hypothetical protein